MRITGNRLDFAEINADTNIIHIPYVINWKRIIVIILFLILPTWLFIEFIFQFSNIPYTSTENIIIILMTLISFSVILVNIYKSLN